MSSLVFTYSYAEMPRYGPNVIIIGLDTVKPLKPLVVFMREQNLNKIFEDLCPVHIFLKSLYKMNYGLFCRSYAMILIYILTGYYTAIS